MEETAKQKATARNETKKLLASLNATAEESTSIASAQLDALTQLKILSRSQSGAEALFAEHCLSILSRYAFMIEPNGSDLEALRCLANVLLLAPQSRQNFVNLGAVTSIVSELPGADVEHEFLFARLLFLVTYGTECDFRVLIEKHNLDTIIIQNLKRHVEASQHRKAAGSAGDRTQMETMALAETLKLLFNVVYHNPGVSESLDAAVSPVLTLLRNEEVPDDNPLDPVMGYIVNALLNLNLSVALEALFPETDLHLYTHKLTCVLESAMEHYTIAEQDIRAPPLLSLIATVFSIAPPEVQSRLKTILLPSDAERNLPLGQTDSLSGRLLRLSTTARTPELRDVILSLMYDMSDKDPATFVRNVGYGYASGFFVNHNIQTAGLLPLNNSSASGDSGRVTEIFDEEEQVEGNGVRGRQEGVNFVTGQYLADEPEQPDDDMTEEEKLREAERLYVLFERLKATGVVDVENPVQTAARSGQLDRS